MVAGLHFIGIFLSVCIQCIPYSTLHVNSLLSLSSEVSHLSVTFKQWACRMLKINKKLLEGTIFRHVNSGSYVCVCVMHAYGATKCCRLLALLLMQNTDVFWYEQIRSTLQQKKAFAYFVSHLGYVRTSARDRVCDPGRGKPLLQS